MARLVAVLAIGICFFAVVSILASSGGDEPVNSGDAKSEAVDDRSGSASDNTATETKPVKSTYKVRAGDSFASIAEEVGVSVEELQQLNPEIDPRALQPGQKLKLK